MDLKLNHITYAYPGAEGVVFDDLSLTLGEPGFHALFGPSGVGKTTLARIITGDIRDYQGDLQAGEMSSLLYSYNLERLPGWSSIGAHLEKITRPELKARRDEMLRDFGLEKHINSRFSQLSLGQQNRVNLIRYLLQDFQLLIMDESLANVDELTRGRIILKIKEMFPEALFLYISHNVVEVSKFCRQILILRGAGKKPQIALVHGKDAREGQALDQNALEHTMLEIVNAS